ncbi:hypothetical protein AN477_18860 [Alicyclobacillus ferrooxydans]|uniref:Probable inorganic carbon transporter subunit DabB n=2 Tax=Alicyclobacillus ferrooxydans TaxID=471514 RepID=A0A0P9C9W8_9BACL|nr:hypothetical protein AN477_18860 [Alicyclobacillus ferrooxydans]
MANLYLGALALCVISALIFLSPRVSIRYVFVHQGLLILPSLAAIVALTSGDTMTTSFWHLSRLGWLVAAFVNIVNAVVQRFSIRYLLGDRKYRQYFTLFTVTTAVNSLTWLMNDIRWMALCWGVSLIGMLLLFSLNRSSASIKIMVRQAALMFALSWVSFTVAAVLVRQTVKSWDISVALSQTGLAHMTASSTTAIDFLLVLTAIIPAAQWPFQRWLVHSAAVPTPVSAVMHAGFVNVGGVLLTVFSPLFQSIPARETLFAIAAVSILIGTGIMRVHVDYKRQLVASTIAQMGFMLVQCSLGAYVAAVIHLVMHGFFKSSLFFQSGSVIKPKIATTKVTTPTLWSLLSVLLVGVIVALGYWLVAPSPGYRLLSAVILGCAAGIGWHQLVVDRMPKSQLLIGIGALTVSALTYQMVHAILAPWLQLSPASSVVLPTGFVVVSVLWLTLTGVGMYWLHRQTTRRFSKLYLWLVYLGEPSTNLIQVRPAYPESKPQVRQLVG